jgi:hypothetical protein
VQTALLSALMLLIKQGTAQGVSSATMPAPPPPAAIG